MANGVKTYEIKINGLQESINAVDSLNKQLDKLEQKMKTLSSAKVSTGGGGSTKANSALSEEERTQKEINKLKEQGKQLDAKILAAQDEIYKRVDATKQLYKETIADQKALAAQERLSADAYSNTMQGMKQQLADLKAVINTTDIGDSGQIKKMTQQANELTNKLKQMEEAYGQFGRNVGNYKSAFDQLKQVTVTVGNTQRTFNSVRDASRQLTQELKAMAMAGKEDTKEYEELSDALHNFEMASRKAESAVNDLKASSKGMDDILDTFQSLAALGQIGQGLTAFFGFDDTEIQRSIQKLVALQNVMQGIEKIRQQMNTQEGIGKIFSKGSTAIDDFISKLTGAKMTMDGLTMSSRAATVAVRGLSLALKAIGVGIAMYGISKVISMFEQFKEGADTATNRVKILDESLKTLNKTYSERRDLMTSSYMRGELSNEDFLTNQYKLQSEYIAEQINLLRERMAIMNEQSGILHSMGLYFDESTSSYRGGKMNGDVTVSSYNSITSFGNPTLNITAKDIKEVEEAWRKCNEAIKEGKDYFDKWGTGLSGWFNSLFTTVKDTERVMRELGNVEIGNFIGEFGEVNEQFKNGEISAEQFAKELTKLKNQLNDNDVLRSVIANLDKYIPDDAVREKIDNIINTIIKLDDSFNMTSPEQIRHWAQVRIDGMKQGQAKIRAQIDADEKYEIAQYGKTQEQINLIHAKYQRKRLDEEEKYNEQSKNKAKQHARELENALREYNALRIELMDDGLAKELAKLNEEKRQRIQKAKENGVDVNMVIQLYDKKILEAKKNWAYNVEQIYVDMWKKIYDINHNNSKMDFENQQRNLQQEYNKLRDKASNKLAGSPVSYSEKNVEVSDGKVLIEKDEAYTKRLKEEYNRRINDRKAYYAELQRLATEEAEKQYQIENEKAKEAMNNELRTLYNGYAAQDHEMEQHLKKGEISLERYKEAVERLAKERRDQEAKIEEKYNSLAEERERKHQEKIKSIKNQEYSKLVDEYQSYYEKLANIDTSETVRNGLGFTNVAATRRRNDELVAEWKRFATDVEATIRELKTKLDSIDLTEQERNDIERLMNALERLRNAAKKKAAQIQDDSKKASEELMNDVARAVSLIGSQLSSIVQSFADFADQEYENTINELEKQIDDMQELYERQEEIVSQHKENIDNIEDELATARGDRRQYLIDKLNAEIAAERAGIAEKKKIQQQEKALEEKKMKEEKDRKEEQKKWAKTQAIINGAVAFMNALSTQPIWLGLVLAALTAVQTAAQIATIDSAKYADGGVIQGKSHAQGGVKVLGGQAEVEGQEFITNRQTTSKNVDLLYYINSKKKKLDLSDFIEFYSSGNMTKNISPTKRVFADGGQIPTLRNDIDINDRLLAAFEDYSNRNVVVSVVDINNRQEAVKNVQVLAGLDND